jgi:predicted nucleic acid-binding protein
MPAFLLDTNVLSEIRKGPSRAQPEVWQWWLAMQDQPLFLSVMTLGEIRKGIDRLATRDQRQAFALERWLEGVKESFKAQLIDITPAIAERWGRLQAIRVLPEVDALLASTALHHDLTLVTRNEGDFDGLGVRVLNPFLKQ